MIWCKITTFCEENGPLRKICFVYGNILKDTPLKRQVKELLILKIWILVYSGAIWLVKKSNHDTLMKCKESNKMFLKLLPLIHSYNLRHYGQFAVSYWVREWNFNSSDLGCRAVTFKFCVFIESKYHFPISLQLILQLWTKCENLYWCSPWTHARETFRSLLKVTLAMWRHKIKRYHDWIFFCQTASFNPNRERIIVMHSGDV